MQRSRTGIDAEQIKSLTAGLVAVPESFHIHPKVKKLYEQRTEMAEGKRPFDYGMAELLAFASLVTAGTPVRLTGQDSQRGTFNQRHSVLTDTETEAKYIPLEHMAADQARFEVYNTLLSEAAVLGFEYGYSRDYPEALVLWEAQFGDFANGAQIIIDQFISAGEAKWHLLSGLVMLLPHGYEGQGPEHSSARLERFLQLAANDNMIIAQAFDRRPALPSAAPAGDAQLAQAADCDDAEEHAAASGCVVERGGFCHGSLPQRACG